MDLGRYTFQTLTCRWLCWYHSEQISRSTNSSASSTPQSIRFHQLLTLHCLSQSCLDLFLWSKLSRRLISKIYLKVEFHLVALFCTCMMQRSLWLQIMEIYYELACLFNLQSILSFLLGLFHLGENQTCEVS